jgi:hypothetical protein
MISQAVQLIYEPFVVRGVVAVLGRLFAHARVAEAVRLGGLF